NLCQIKKEMTEILNDTKNMQMPRPISILKSSKSITTPKLITPQIPVKANIEENTIIKENIQKEPSQKDKVIQPKLQQPTALKVPISNQSGVIEATPLAKPERLKTPKNIPNNPLPAKLEETTMEDLEKSSLDTNQWINKTPKSNEIAYNPQSQIDKQQNNTSLVTPVTPKSKPIETKNNPAPVQTQNYSSEIPSALPKPKQRSPPKPIFNENTNKIIKTFPNGNLCNGCSVSQSNSWRFCPLCGFNN
ncbi:MAG TPA: hypothetical protein QF644_03685, partial [Candidatus Poseidoniaceae archaeon]|nr:hypothetical protein [Candidatus Poseidoniaceae archaeon]